MSKFLKKHMCPIFLPCIFNYIPLFTNSIRAENENYALFMESTSIEYYTERHCELMQIGDLLDSKSYGIGMKMGTERIIFCIRLLLFFFYQVKMNNECS